MILSKRLPEFPVKQVAAAGCSKRTAKVYATWSRFTASDAERNCRRLAELANSFKRMQGAAQQVVEDFRLRLHGPGTAIADKVVARLVAKKSVGLAASSLHFSVIIRCIRVLGIYLLRHRGTQPPRLPLSPRLVQRRASRRGGEYHQRRIGPDSKGALT
jgi:hypothetical protein